MFDPENPRLQNLLLAAGLRTDIRHRLLNGQRRQVAVEFGFSEPEIETLIAVRADTMRDFVQGIRELTTRQQLNAA